MTNRLCLFEDKLNDKRFYETEMKIFGVCLGEEIMSVDILVRRVGVSRATFYRHHKSIECIVLDYRDLLDARVERWAGRMETTEGSTRKLFRGILVFVLQNQWLFEFLALKGRGCPFVALVERAKVLIVRENTLLGNEVIYLVYAAEMAAILRMWGEQGYDKEMMEFVLENMLFLTGTAGIRLSPLGEQKGESDKTGKGFVFNGEAW